MTRLRTLYESTASFTLGCVLGAFLFLGALHSYQEIKAHQPSPVQEQGVDRMEYLRLQRER